MHVFKHPKYYKELRKRNRDLSELQQVKLERSVPQSDQAISEPSSTEQVERAPGPGPKRQASSGKPQAASLEKQASSPEEQASSRKP
jgi:hypothetical protein